jgi:hypothetical protein
MTRFLLLYVGPATPPDASHEGWAEWFAKLGERLVDRGSAIVDGRALHGDGTTGAPAATLNGYSIIEAADQDEALGLIADHPYLTQGREYSIETHALP